MKSMPFILTVVKRLRLRFTASQLDSNSSPRPAELMESSVGLGAFVSGVGCSETLFSFHLSLAGGSPEEQRRRFWQTKQIKLLAGDATRRLCNALNIDLKGTQLFWETAVGPQILGGAWTPVPPPPLIPLIPVPVASAFLLHVSFSSSIPSFLL